MRCHMKKNNHEITDRLNSMLSGTNKQDPITETVSFNDNFKKLLSVCYFISTSPVLFLIP